uniref:Putative secreted protein n=1 Tax=Rhipicephalus microplus TaxID=6941 RepID=A0A6G5A1D6_RHIMP
MCTSNKVTVALLLISLTVTTWARKPFEHASGPQSNKKARLSPQPRLNCRDYRESCGPSAECCLPFKCGPSGTCY